MNHPEAFSFIWFEWYQCNQSRGSILSWYISANCNLFCLKHSSHKGLERLLTSHWVNWKNNVNWWHVIMSWDAFLFYKSKNLEGSWALVFHLLVHNGIYRDGVSSILKSFDYVALINWSHIRVIMNIEDCIINYFISLWILIKFSDCWKLF